MKNQLQITIALFFTSLVLCIFIAGCKEEKVNATVPNIEWQKMADVGTLKLVFEDAAIYKGFGIYIGYLYQGEAIIGSSIKNVNANENSVIVTLEEPRRINHRIDYENSNPYKIIGRVWRRNVAVDNAIQELHRLEADHIAQIADNDVQINKIAKRQAETIFRGIYALANVENVNFEWVTGQ